MKSNRLLATAALLALTCTARANLLVNGTFEDPAVAADTHSLYINDSLGGYVDAVSLTTVPKPSVLDLLAAAGLAALTLLRRRNAV